MEYLFIILGIIGVAAIYIIFVYNGLIALRNQKDESWSDIDVQLKRRYDLIPNVVETVKGYAKHEDKVLNDVTEARTKAMNAKGLKEQGEAENIISGTLKTLFAVAENYPQLKANENFLKLQEELSDTENKIQAARRFYNSIVRDFNTKLEVFPNNFISIFFGFQKSGFFEIEEPKERENVKVQF